MLTTVTLEAQELSMPSSAATPPKLGAIADASGHGDHRRCNEAAYHAGKRAFHSGHTNNHTSLSQLALAVFEQAMDTCHANVVEGVRHGCPSCAK